MISKQTTQTLQQNSTKKKHQACNRKQMLITGSIVGSAIMTGSKCAYNTKQARKNMESTAAESKADSNEKGAQDE